MKLQKPIRKLFNLFIVTILLFTMIPANVFASEGEPHSDIIDILTEVILDLDRVVSDIDRRVDNLEIDRGDVSPGAPRVRVIDPQIITIEAGQTLEVPITIRNLGALPANELLTQVAPFDSSPFIAEFTDARTVRHISSNGTTTKTLRITVDRNASSGTHTLGLTHFFRNPGRDNLLADDDAITIRIVGVAEDSDVRMVDFSTSVGDHRPGRSFVLSANVISEGTPPPRDVSVTILNNPSGITFDRMSFHIGTWTSELPRMISTIGRVPDVISHGVHPIEFRVSFIDASNRRQERTFFYYIIIDPPQDEDEDETLPRLEIRNIQTHQGNLRVGETGNITFTLANITGEEVENIRVEAIIADSADIVPSTASIRTIPVMGVGAIYNLSFGFMPRASASTQSYSIGFRVSAGHGANARVLFEQFTAINVFNPDPPERHPEDPAARRQIPRIIVSGYTVYPLIPRAGQEFEMAVTFRNTNSTRSVNNIRIVLEALEGTPGQGAVFTPVGGFSNTLFIDHLNPLEEYTKVLRFFTVNDADPRSYSMRVTFNYQDAEFFEFESSENLAISVAQIVRLEVSPFDIPPQDMVGSAAWLRFSVMNTGRVELRNLRVRVDGPEGAFDTRQANILIGNLIPGRSITYDGEFRFLTEGVHSGAVVVYGEDATGDIIEFRHDFTIDVMGFGGGFDDDFRGGDFEIMPGRPDFGFPPDMETGFFDPETGMWVEGGQDGDGFFAGVIDFVTRPFVWIPAAGVVVAVIVIIAVMVRKKKNKLVFEEDDD